MKEVSQRKPIEELRWLHKDFTLLRGSCLNEPFLLTLISIRGIQTGATEFMNEKIKPVRH